MRLGLAVVAALLAPACVSTSQLVWTKHAVLAVEEAKGLTRAEFAQRLGVAGPQNALVLSAEWDDGAIVSVVSNAALLGNSRCGDDGYPGLQMWHGEPTDADDLSDMDRLSPPAVFRDGRYVGPIVDTGRTGDDAGKPAYIVTTCLHRPSGFGAATVVFAPLAVGYVAFKATGEATSAAIASGHMIGHDINGILATLPLGAEPTGGPDIWLANHPAAAVLIERQGDTVSVGLHAETPAQPDSDSPYAVTFRANRLTAWAVKVTFTQGVVTRLEPNVFWECELSPSRAVRCGKRDLG